MRISRKGYLITSNELASLVKSLSIICHHFVSQLLLHLLLFTNPFFSSISSIGPVFYGPARLLLRFSLLKFN